MNDAIMRAVAVLENNGFADPIGEVGLVVQRLGFAQAGVEEILDADLDVRGSLWAFLSFLKLLEWLGVDGEKLAGLFGPVCADAVRCLVDAADWHRSLGEIADLLFKVGYFKGTAESWAMGG